MEANYKEIQELLRSRADLQARLNLMPYDGTPEIKERIREITEASGAVIAEFMKKNCWKKL